MAAFQRYVGKKYDSYDSAMQDIGVNSHKHSAMKLHIRDRGESLETSKRMIILIKPLKRPANYV